MLSPVQVVTLLRPKTRADLLAAAAFSSLVFTATPFLIPATAEDFDVSLGAASLISTAQLAGFVLASWVVGRFFDPSRRLFVTAIALATVANGLSALVPWYSGLLVLRLVAGAAIAVLAWLGWQEVFGDDDRMGDVAVVGPVVGIAGAPLASFLAEAAGTAAVYGTLAGVGLLPLLLRPPGVAMGANAPRRFQRSRAIPVTRLILLCLSVITFSGSAVFVFLAALGEDSLGIDPVVLSLAFSANAAVGIPAARYRGRRPLAGLWLLGTATAAITTTTVDNAPVFWIALALWGFFFWAGVPGIFKLLAERSANPADRAGDAQSVMAAGRVFGPLFGAAFVEGGSVEALGITAGALLAAAAITLAVTERRVPPRRPES